MTTIYLQLVPGVEGWERLECALNTVRNKLFISLPYCKVWFLNNYIRIFFNKVGALNLSVIFGKKNIEQ